MTIAEACELAAVSRAGFYRNYQEHQPCTPEAKVITEDKSFDPRPLDAFRIDLHYRHVRSTGPAESPEPQSP